MSAEANKKIVNRFYEASNRGDMETCLALIADDIEWTNIGTTSLSGTFRGKEQLTEQLLGPLFGRLKDGMKSTVHRLIAEDDFVVAQSSGKAETVDGHPYDNTYCWVIRIRDGKFAQITEYMDTALVSSTFD
jgi:hypothetical protein